MISVITFDLDNTLWEIDPVIVRANRAMTEWIAAQLPEAVARLELKPFMALRDRVAAEHPHIAGKPTFLRKKMLYEVFRDLELEHEHAERMSEQAFEVFYHHRNQVTLFHDAEELLHNLSRRYTLIALTNGNADLERIGIDRYFAAHFNADKVARPKPYADMFQAALDFAGVKPEQCIHIGDHPDEDVAAAAALGFHTIWFQPPYAKPRPGFEPAYHATELKQIPDMIRDIEESSGTQVPEPHR